MARRFDVNNGLLYPFSAQNKVIGFREAVMSLKKKEERAQRTISRKAGQDTAIVRIIESVNSEQIDPEIVNYPFSDFEIVKSATYNCLSLEIEGISEPWCKKIRKEISDEEYENSLIKIYLSSDVSELSLPKQHEVVRIVYNENDDSDFLSIQSVVRSKEQIKDPNINKCAKEENERTRNSFPSGA